MDWGEQYWLWHWPGRCGADFFVDTGSGLRSPCPVSDCIFGLALTGGHVSNNRNFGPLFLLQLIFLHTHHHRVLTYFHRRWAEFEKPKARRSFACLCVAQATLFPCACSLLSLLEGNEENTVSGFWIMIFSWKKVENVQTTILVCSGFRGKSVGY